MILNRNKGINQITYNHLNLPKEIKFGNNDKIEYLYTATGEKVQKKVMEGNQTQTTDYLNSFQYLNEKLSFFPTAEGYVKVTKTGESGMVFNYVYNYTDHLGNIRLRYTRDPQDDSKVKILEEDHYYPFGLKHKGYNNEHNIIIPPFQGHQNTVEIIPITPAFGEVYKYKYNGKELQDELSLNWYDYGARNYDAALGRYFNMDRFSEAYIDLNPYQYTANNPVKFIDVNGDYIYIWDENRKYRYENGEVQKQNEDGKWETHQAKEGSYLSQVSAFLGEITGGDENSFGSRFLSLFENDNINVDIRENNSNKKDSKGKNITQGTTIYTSFHQKGSIRTTGGTEKLSQNYHTILFHELGHGFANNVISTSVLNAAWISPDSSIGLDKPIRKSEVFASMVENMLRAEQGLNLRTHYIGGSSDERSRLIIKSKSQSPFSTTYEPTEATRAIWNEFLKSRKE